MVGFGPAPLPAAVGPPGRRWDTVAEQLLDAPDMIGQAGRQGRGALDPAMAIGADREFPAQTVMVSAEVVDTTHHIHAGSQGRGTPGQGARAAPQGAQPLPKGGVEALDEGGVNPPLALRGLDQSGYQTGVALYDPAVDVQPAGHFVFDDLHNGDVG